MVSNILPSPIYVLAITSVIQNYKPVSDLNMILFANLQLIQFPDIKHLHIKILGCLFTFCQFFPNFCNHNTVISITFSSVERSYVECFRMSSPIQQYVISLVVSVLMRRVPGVFWKALVWEHLALNK